MRVGSEKVSVRREEREEGSMDFRFRKVIERFCLMTGVGMSMFIIRARWSEKVVSVEPEVVRLLMVIPVVQIKSRVCPLL